MFGVFKKLFARRPSAPPADFTPTPVAVPPASGPRVTPARALATPVAPRVVPAPLSPAVPVVSPRVERQGEASSETIRVPLPELVKRLPEELRALMLRPPSVREQVDLPLSGLLEQMARGAVRIPFGKLRQASPEDLFSTAGTSDNVPVPVPLELLLRVLPSELLVRRSGQRRVTISTDIAALFPQPKGIAVSQPLSKPLIDESPAGVKAAPSSPTSVEVPAPQAAAPQATKPPLRLAVPAEAETTRPPVEIPDSMSAPQLPEPAPAMAPGTPATPEVEQPTAPAGGFVPAAMPAPEKKNEPVRPITAGPSAITLPRPPVDPPPAFRGGPSTVDPARVLPGISSGPVKPLAVVAPPASTTAPRATPVSVPQPAGAPSGLGPEVETLAISLDALTATWPEALKQALMPFNPHRCTIRLPLTEIETGLRRGKLAFSWSQLRGWTKPILPPFEDLVQETNLLALPLNAIVPLFLARKQSGGGAKKVTVADNIPNLFLGVRSVAAAPERQPEVGLAAPDREITAPAEAIPAPESAVQASLSPSSGPVAAPGLSRAVSDARGELEEAAVEVSPLGREGSLESPVPSATARPAEPAQLLATRSAAAIEARDLGELFGQPAKRNWTPMEIVQKSAKLPGVSGALVALQDGLMVACELPPDLNGEMIAAFLPQMFGRVAHYTKQLSLGEPSCLSLVAKQVPMRIFRAGTVYFLAFGRTNESLPDAALGLVAAHLERQSNLP